MPRLVVLTQFCFYKKVFYSVGLISDHFQVHKVIPGTLADRDGRIQKGDRVLSINGRSTKGVTHREALSILKVVIMTMTI